MENKGSPDSMIVLDAVNNFSAFEYVLEATDRK